MSSPKSVDAKRPFPLTALFTSVSLVAIVATTVAMVVLIGQQERRSLVARGEDYAVQVANHLDSVLLDEVIGINEGFDRTSPLSRHLLDDVIGRHIKSFRVSTVVLFDPTGQVVYSTDWRLIGQRKSEDEGFQAAAEGRGPFSELKLAGSPAHIGGLPEDRDLLEVYCSSRAFAEAPDEPGGVLELYIDASSLTAELTTIRTRIALITATSMTALFGILYFLIRRAHRIIRAQTQEIEKSNRDLEQTVAERTAELIRTQGQLIEAAQLAAVGTLAAGVAHEINNPLASVAACAEGMLSRAQTAAFRDDPDFAEFPEYLRIIKDEAFRCKEVTRQLLDLARPRPRLSEVVHLQETIADVMVLLSQHPALKNGKIHTDRSQATLVGDPGEIKQVLLNLIQNALDAIAERECGEVWLSATEEGEFVAVQVEDNGAGFTSEQATHLFEPFYTTKEAGQGTGLGLAMSQVIARRHGGRLTASSPGPGAGASFELRVRREPAA